MCLSTVYSDMKKEPICKNVAKVSFEGEKIVLIDIMGRKTVIDGSISDIDLMENIIKIKEKHLI